jgi:hypothetical protein
VLLLAGLALVVVLLVGLIRAGRSARADRVFRMLMDPTAQIRIWFAMALLIAFLALAAPFAVRALPALLYRAQSGMRHTMAPGFLQDASMPFIVAAAQIGQRLGALPPSSELGMIPCEQCACALLTPYLRCPFRLWFTRDLNSGWFGFRPNSDEGEECIVDAVRGVVQNAPFWA